MLRKQASSILQDFNIIIIQEFDHIAGSVPRIVKGYKSFINNINICYAVF
jgi:hypothetical protein